jgi:hypothetical protein
VVLHADVRPPQPMRPGRIARRDSEYQRRSQRLLRRGAESRAALYQTDTNRSSPQFRNYLVEIVASYPRADTILLVMDNLSSHNCKAPMDRFDEEIGGPLWERFTVHCAPKYGSRLNHAEIEISLFSRQCLWRRRFQSLGQLHRQARAWNRKMSRDGVTINWQFTRINARQKVGYHKNKFTRSQT